MRRVMTFMLVILAAVLLLAACGSDSDDNKSDLPEARSLLNEAAGKVQNADTFMLEIGVSGYPVFIDTGDAFNLDIPLTFQYAEDVAFDTPNALHAKTVQFNIGDVGLTAELIGISDQQYLRSDLLTRGQWLNQQIIPGFTPESLMTDDGGIAHALESIVDVDMVGKKDLDGVDVYHVRGTIDAASVNSLTFGLIGTKSGLLDIDVTILTGERVVYQIVLTEPLPEGVDDQDPTVWTIELHDYNTPLTIAAPEPDD
ncbi:MAG: LppX_LprAFG lipoprotein [Anaerolineae bacterium]|nr:LppX_LprAFG lipoprotein [Anaerolineae bacterium]